MNAEIATRNENFSKMESIMLNRSKQDKFYNLAIKQKEIVGNLLKELDREQKKLDKYTSDFLSLNPSFNAENSNLVAANTANLQNSAQKADEKIDESKKDEPKPNAQNLSDFGKKNQPNDKKAKEA